MIVSELIEHLKTMPQDAEIPFGERMAFSREENLTILISRVRAWEYSQGKRFPIIGGESQ